MRCVVTAGPTYEPLDQVRRLTNHSTGRLGVGLANFLAGRGHEVTLLLGSGATWAGERRAQHVELFTTTASLRARFEQLAGPQVEAVFHAAAVSDFGFGKVFRHDDAGGLEEFQEGKLSTRQGRLLAELVPTPKLISHLRAWFPQAFLVGWKYEVEGGQPSVLRKAEEQIRTCRTDACAANGPAYGPGFGLVRLGSPVIHLGDDQALFAQLAQLAEHAQRPK